MFQCHEISVFFLLKEAKKERISSEWYIVLFFKKIEHFFFIKSGKCGDALIEKLKVMEPQSLQFLKWSEGNRQNPKKNWPY